MFLTVILLVRVCDAGYGDRVSYVSTGGALLEYVEGKVLPGGAALEG